MNIFKENKYINKLNNDRLDYFIEKLSSKKVNTLLSFSFIKEKNIEIITCAPLLWADLFIISILSFIGNLKLLMVIAYEMYHIDTIALKTERQIYKRFFKNSLFAILKFEIGGFIKALNLYIKLLVLRLISKNSNLRIVVHSDLRKKYLEERDIWKNSKIDFCRHFPMALSKDFDFKSDDFILLAGRINNMEDFQKIINYSVTNFIDIYVVGNGHEELQRSSLVLPPNIKLLGSIPHEEVLIYVARSLAGIVLYENTSINQKLSASTKLFEFLYFGKPVVCSKNPGLLGELESTNARFCIVDELINVKPTYFKDESLNKFNNEFTYEREVERYLRVSKFYVSE